MCVLVTEWVPDLETQGMVMVTGLTVAEFGRVMEGIAAKLKSDNTSFFSGALWITCDTPVAPSAHFIGRNVEEENSEA